MLSLNNLVEIVGKKFVICEINAEYLKNIKSQMKKQKLPMPKNDANITLSHKPVAEIDLIDRCPCNVCTIIKKSQL